MSADFSILDVNFLFGGTQITLSHADTGRVSNNKQHKPDEPNRATETTKTTKNGFVG